LARAGNLVVPVTNSLSIRTADVGDAETLVGLIQELAVYERLEQEARASVEDIEIALTQQQPPVGALLATVNGEAIGFAIYFFNFSTFLGVRGLYLEDLFVREQHRGNGYGRALFMALVQTAVELGCGRMEWSVLDWNEKAIEFYRRMGAAAMDEWTVFRLDRNALVSLMARQDGR